MRIKLFHWRKPLLLEQITMFDGLPYFSFLVRSSNIYISLTFSFVIQLISLHLSNLHQFLKLQRQQKYFIISHFQLGNSNPLFLQIQIHLFIPIANTKRNYVYGRKLTYTEMLIIGTTRHCHSLSLVDIIATADYC